MPRLARRADDGGGDGDCEGVAESHGVHTRRFALSSLQPPLTLSPAVACWAYDNDA